VVVAAAAARAAAGQSCVVMATIDTLCRMHSAANVHADEGRLFAELRTARCLMSSHEHTHNTRHYTSDVGYPRLPSAGRDSVESVGRPVGEHYYRVPVCHL